MLEGPVDPVVPLWCELTVRSASEITCTLTSEVSPREDRASLGPVLWHIAVGRWFPTCGSWTTGILEGPGNKKIAFDHFDHF